jgi:hypothetical protein
MPEEERRGYYADLRGLGYRVHQFNGDPNYAGPELEPDDMMRWKQFDLFAVPER